MGHFTPTRETKFFVKSFFYTWPDIWNIYVHTKFSIIINYSFYWIWKIYNCVDIFSTPDVDMLHSACSVCTLCLNIEYIQLRAPDPVNLWPDPQLWVHRTAGSTLFCGFPTISNPSLSFYHTSISWIDDFLMLNLTARN